MQWGSKMDNIKLKQINELLFVNKIKIIKISIPLLLVCIGVFAITSSKRIINRDINEIFQISDEIRGHYVGKYDYWMLSTNMIIKEKMISNNFITDNKIILSSGKEVFVGEGVDTTPVMPMHQSYDIVIKNLNKAECINFVEYSLSEDKLVSLQKISIYNKNGAIIYEWGGDNSLPVKKYSSKDYCADTENNVIWSMK